MSGPDYSMFARRKFAPDDLGALKFDVLISAYNDSPRVDAVHQGVAAADKRWIAHGEYQYEPEELPEGAWCTREGESAAEAWIRYFAECPVDPGSEVAIDITGMMRPHLLLLPVILRRAGFSRVTFLYGDPLSYVSGQDTSFTQGPVDRVAIVPGLAGTHLTAMESRDFMVVGAGYDHALVKAVVESKRGAEHHLVVGMPGLQAHMYQESIFRLSKVKESIKDFRPDSFLFAPANNPFMTAQVVSDHVRRMRSVKGYNNAYLCPLGPKAQVLGFALYFLYEAAGCATSVLFPYAKRYSRETSLGLAAVHAFEVELDWVVPS